MKKSSDKRSSSSLSDDGDNSTCIKYNDRIGFMTANILRGLSGEIISADTRSEIVSS